MKIYYRPSFVRQYANFETSLQEEIKEKIELFRSGKNHKSLKIHKLKGKLAKHYSFSVNYRYRIVFIYQSSSEAVLLVIGDHDVYS